MQITILYGNQAWLIGWQLTILWLHLDSSALSSQTRLCTAETLPFAFATQAVPFLLEVSNSMRSCSGFGISNHDEPYSEDFRKIREYRWARSIIIIYWAPRSPAVRCPVIPLKLCAMLSWELDTFCTTSELCWQYCRLLRAESVALKRHTGHIQVDYCTYVCKNTVSAIYASLMYVSLLRGSVSVAKQDTYLLGWKTWFVSHCP